MSREIMIWRSLSSEVMTMTIPGKSSVCQLIIFGAFMVIAQYPVEEKPKN